MNLYYNVVEKRAVKFESDQSRPELIKISQSTLDYIDNGLKKNKIVILVNGVITLAEKPRFNKQYILDKDEGDNWHHRLSDMPLASTFEVIANARRMQQSRGRYTVVGYGTLPTDNAVFEALVTISQTTTVGRTRVFKYIQPAVGNLPHVVTPDVELLKALPALTEFRQALFDIESELFEEASRGLAVDLNRFEDAHLLLRNDGD